MVCSLVPSLASHAFILRLSHISNERLLASHEMHVSRYVLLLRIMESLTMKARRDGKIVLTAAAFLVHVL